VTVHDSTHMACYFSIRTLDFQEMHNENQSFSLDGHGHSCIDSATRVCKTQDVPIYEEAKSGEGNIGGLIVGGLIGSAIGNKLSDANGGGAAGAVAGALLGHEASKNKGNKEIVGYRREEVCSIQRVVLEETIERIDGYRLEVEIDNRIITLESKREYEKGQRVEIAKRTTYSLK